MNRLKTWLVGTPARVRVVPFLVFAGLTMFQGQLGAASPYWVYLGKTLVGVGLVWLVWPQVVEMRWGWSWEAAAAGVGVFVVWVGLDAWYPHLDALMAWIQPLADKVGLGSWFTVKPHQAWNPHRVFGEGSVVAWCFAVMRWFGSTIVVPPLEEVFYRSFLWRYVASKDFMSVRLEGWRWTPGLVTSLVFGLAHQEWLAGILCGLAYQALVCRRGRLGEAMTAHAITNGLLGLWVIGRVNGSFGETGVAVTPCVIHEDEAVLVVNKPPGWNTHAPAPYAGEGIYDWLRRREPRWAKLAILHRLDRDTSGVLVFGKTAEANRSLTQQFESRQVSKQYRLRTASSPEWDQREVRLAVVRRGASYAARPAQAGDPEAVTRFRVVKRGPGFTEIEAEPLTGRTHQIRVHAAAVGIPVLGDATYGGAPYGRSCLHAERLEFRHPLTCERVGYEAPAGFEEVPAVALRRAVVDPSETDSYRVAHGGADGVPGWSIDRWNAWVVCQALEAAPSRDTSASRALPAEVMRLLELHGLRGSRLGVYVQQRARPSGVGGSGESSPGWLEGPRAPQEILVRENGVCWEIRFDAGASVGLFLDQRDNRRRLLSNYVAPGFAVREGGMRGAAVLNLFAYTCGFSVVAALAGARATSVDLSAKSLEWGRRNFGHNGLDASRHEFLAGDAFAWIGRLSRKGRRFEVVVVDPPTFSRSKEHGVFRAEHDYGELAAGVAPLVAEGGVFLACTNAGGITPEAFVKTVQAAVEGAGRSVRQQEFCPQPPDFPVTRDEPGYLKTVWMRLG